MPKQLVRQPRNISSWKTVMEREYRVICAGWQIRLSEGKLHMVAPNAKKEKRVPVASWNPKKRRNEPGSKTVSSLDDIMLPCFRF